MVNWSVPMMPRAASEPDLAIDDQAFLTDFPTNRVLFSRPMFGNDRRQLRQYFFSAWDKHRHGHALTALEQVIVEVIRMHPEYHVLMDDPENHLERDWTPEQGQTNPFLHMSMHISIQEQLGANQPSGIRTIYQSLMARSSTGHDVEHQMMDCLGLVMWQSQSTGREPDQQQYLECLKKIQPR